MGSDHRFDRVRAVSMRDREIVHDPGEVRVAAIGIEHNLLKSRKNEPDRTAPFQIGLRQRRRNSHAVLGRRNQFAFTHIPHDRLVGNVGHDLELCVRSAACRRARP